MGADPLAVYTCPAGSRLIAVLPTLGGSGKHSTRICSKQGWPNMWNAVQVHAHIVRERVPPFPAELGDSATTGSVVLGRAYLNPEHVWDVGVRKWGADHIMTDGKHAHRACTRSAPAMVAGAATAEQRSAHAHMLSPVPRGS